MIESFLSPEVTEFMKTLYKGLCFYEQICPCNYKFGPKGQVNFFDVIDGERITTYRFDTPHDGYPYQHLNMNPRFFNRPDPHIWMPPGTTFILAIFLKPLRLMLSIAKFGQKLLLTSMLAQSVINDWRFGTTRNTIESLVNIGGVSLTLFIAGKIGK